MEETKIEQKTAETILQQPRDIELAGKTYSVAPPSIATLILISKEIATLPHAAMREDKIIEDTLAFAKDSSAIGKIIATLILGAREAQKTETRMVKKEKTTSVLGFKFKRHFWTEEKYSPLEELADELLERATPRELQNATARILQMMQIGDFFGLSTFLLEINMTKATKVDEATASGQ